MPELLPIRDPSSRTLSGYGTVFPNQWASARLLTASRGGGVYSASNYVRLVQDYFNCTAHRCFSHHQVECSCTTYASVREYAFLKCLYYTRRKAAGVCSSSNRTNLKHSGSAYTQLGSELLGTPIFAHSARQKWNVLV